MLSVPSVPSEFTHEVDPGHPMLPGHFPGRPIVPGAWLLAQVLDDAAALLRGRAPARAVAGVRSVKFTQPIMPGRRFAVSFTERGDELRFSITVGEARCAAGVLELSDAG